VLHAVARSLLRQRTRCALARARARTRAFRADFRRAHTSTRHCTQIYLLEAPAAAGVLATSELVGIIMRACTCTCSRRATQRSRCGTCSSACAASGSVDKTQLLQQRVLLHGVLRHHQAAVARSVLADEGALLLALGASLRAARAAQQPSTAGCRQTI